MLDGHGYVDYVDHRLHAIGHQQRLSHEASAEGAALHTLARTTAVQVDFVIAPLLAQLRAMRQISRFAATQLQRDRMLFGVEAQMPRHVAMDQRAGRDHLGVEKRVAGQQPMEVTAMPVGPIHHGCNAHTVRRRAKTRIERRSGHRTCRGCRQRRRSRGLSPRGCRVARTTREYECRQPKPACRCLPDNAQLQARGPSLPNILRIAATPATNALA